ncbi:MAG TPA: serine/threonine-protein kinase [Gemmatimonadaceae bacterium]|nr:serine/threonine-protein kinase [Gemmatimonadaceae bacterium]
MATSSSSIGSTDSGESRRVAREFPELAAALAGQYALERELGRGGMGVVFLARDLKLDRPVAVKTLLPHLASDPRVRERFLREARTAARLSHPSIVPIHRADEIAGQVFFVMGYVDGESLADRVRARGPLPPAEVAALLGDVALALQAAHGRGVIHRDVKEENILLERESGRAMVTDFGIARLAEAGPLTATGLVLGTVYYMSPEQVSNDPVDGRSDLYSLGVVAFHALAGRFPFESESASAVLVAHVTKPAPRLRDVAPRVPPALAELVDRCLAKSPADRFDSCAAFAVALGSVAARMSEPPARPDLLSETAAQRVWERAAELQARPNAPAPPPPAAPDERRLPPASTTSGYRADVVRESAREAGIGTEFIDRALAERGLAEARGLVPAPTGGGTAGTLAPVGVEDRTTPASSFLGATTKIEFEAVVDGEMDERDFDRLVEAARRGLGDVGLVSAVGRSLAWSSSDPNRKIQVVTQIRAGRTTVRVTERLGMLAGGLFGGVVGGAGTGAGMAIFVGILAVTHAPVAAAGALAAWVASAYGLTRFGYTRTVDARERVLRTLTEDLAAEVRAAVEERERGGRPALPRRR